MRPKDFYAFCRDNRATETDPNKEKALRATFNHMTQHGCSKAVVKAFIGSHFVGVKTSQEMITAYEWLSGILDGTVPSDSTLEMLPVQGE